MTDPSKNGGEDGTREGFLHEESDADVRDLHAPILRELAEPRDGYEPVPVWLIFAFFGLLGWGGWYLGNYTGNWNPLEYDERPAERGAGGGGETAAADPMLLGKRVYNNCVACHRIDGRGSQTYPPLDGSEYVNGDPRPLAAILLHGLQGPIEVEGKIYNSQMPAWGGILTDGQIADALTYVRGSWSNREGPVSADLVKAVRAATNDRRSPWTVDELDARSFDEISLSQPDGPTDASQ
jgi:mono/diheme cytochrome c family protein